MTMRKLFQHKHQRLILQCYPAGKAVDKKPNSSELSYLLYYASARRIKLEKVIEFLRERTTRDAARNRAGNLQVTLQIVSDLIDKCSGNLNVFAHQVCDILQTILDINDVALGKNAIHTYGVFCRNLTSPLFTGDKAFVIKFTSLSQTLISFGWSKTSGPNQYEWQMISLLAINHISNCLGHNPTTTEQFITMCIPMLIHIVQKNTSQQGILARMNVNIESENRRLSRVLSAKTQQDMTRQRIEEDFTNDSLTLNDIVEQAYIDMEVFFNTNSTSQIWQVTKTIVADNIKSKEVDLEFGVVLLQLCVSWIPVQLRFISLSSLLGQMNKATSYDIRYQYGRHLLGLLTSSRVNMVGVSVTDIIQQLLELQCDLFLKENNFTREECNVLTGIYSDCMCNLTTHIYYHDQVPDSIQEILFKIDNVLNSDSKSAGGDQTFDLIIQLLDSVAKIFQSLSKDDANRNHVTLEHWDVSLTILILHVESGGATNLTKDHINSIQLKFLSVFQEFLTNELSIDIDTGSKRESLDDSGLQGKNYLKPDINQYISQQQNFISHLLMYIDKLFTNSTASTKLVSSLISVIKNLINILGINFISNFIPFFNHWQLSKELTQQRKFLDTFAFTILQYILESLDNQYAILENYVKSSKLYLLVLDAIEYRKSNGLWIESIQQDSSSSDSKPPKIKRYDMEVFVCENNFLIQWLHPQKPLITEIDYKTIVTNNKIEFPSSPKDSQHHFEDSSPELIFTNSPQDLVNTSPNLNNSPPTGLNSNYDFSSNTTSINSDNRKYTGLGLGNAGDISSIQNEIMNNSQRRIDEQFSINGAAATASIFTTDSKLNPIRVSDLKSAISSNMTLRKPSFQINDYNPVKNPSPDSILTRNIITTKVDSILDELESEDDKAVIV
ncbi:Protein EFR3 [Spathaspora sp. JA1]|nr:Protein EFR3 [Spathaspora sp. JA1]